jgi:GTPase SAR1 family protein
MASEEDRIRVVMMGDNRVGKSAILNRFLNNTFKVIFIIL